MKSLRNSVLPSSGVSPCQEVSVFFPESLAISEEFDSCIKHCSGRRFAILGNDNLGTTRQVETQKVYLFADTMELAAGGSYSAVTALTNIPATLFGVVLYEIFLVDSDRGK